MLNVIKKNCSKMEQNPVKTDLQNLPVRTKEGMPVRTVPARTVPMPQPVYPQKSLS